MGNPLEFLNETYAAKSRLTRLPYVGNFIILSLNRFCMIRPCVGQTDGRAIAYSLCHMLSCAKSHLQLVSLCVCARARVLGPNISKMVKPMTRLKVFLKSLAQETFASKLAQVTYASAL